MIDVAADMICVVKTNTNGLCKDTIEKQTKDFPGGSYVELKRNYVVPGYSPLMFIRYKYNYWKVLSFIVT